jgi:hypothetical protein
MKAWDGLLELTIEVQRAQCQAIDTARRTEAVVRWEWRGGNWELCPIEEVIPLSALRAEDSPSA